MSFEQSEIEKWRDVLARQYATHRGVAFIHPSLRFSPRAWNRERYSSLLVGSLSARKRGSRSKGDGERAFPFKRTRNSCDISVPLSLCPTSHHLPKSLLVDEYAREATPTKLLEAYLRVFTSGAFRSWKASAYANKSALLGAPGSGVALQDLYTTFGAEGAMHCWQVESESKR